MRISSTSRVPSLVATERLALDVTLTGSAACCPLLPKSCHGSSDSFHLKVSPHHRMTAAHKNLRSEPDAGTHKVATCLNWQESRAARYRRLNGNFLATGAVGCTSSLHHCLASDLSCELHASMCSMHATACCRSYQAGGSADQSATDRKSVV